MRAFAPFEDAPRLAVGVSGGADSLALVHLCHEWAKTGGGSIVALTVDHGLRDESAAEAHTVAAWMRAAGIEHHILRWRGEKPGTAIQEAARRARAALLSAWCRRHGVLHLLLAHQREDQAETLLMRADRGSGPDGLAGMSAVVETPDLRVLRPLLAVPKARLISALESRGRRWLEDPSNRNPAYARARIRRTMSQYKSREITSHTLFGRALRYGHARHDLEERVTARLARVAMLHPAGFAVVEARGLTAPPETVARRSLARLLMCIGGNPYPPRTERLERLAQRLREGGLGAGATLAGCRVIPQGIAGAAGTLLLCREPARAVQRIALGMVLESLERGAGVTWDRRFRIEVGPRAQGGGAPPPLFIARLGREGWSEVVRNAPSPPASRLPLPVRLALPALWDEEGLVAAPHLGYERPGSEQLWRRGEELHIIPRFFPSNPLVGSAFMVAKQAKRTI
jgi:tRNA(Ile)-lysidine synthase